MRKVLLMGLCALMLAGLSACGGSGQTGAEQTTAKATTEIAEAGTEFSENDTGEIQIKEVPSEIYGQEDIDAAIEVIVSEFQANWTGCTLEEIYYAGDDVVKANASVAKNHNADEVMVLMSTFKVDETGGANGSLEPNSTYKDWNWILVRTKGGEWQHVDHGY